MNMNAVMVRRSEHATERKSEREEAKRRSVWQNTMEREWSGKRAESGAPCPLTANNRLHISALPAPHGVFWNGIQNASEPKYQQIL